METPFGVIESVMNGLVCWELVLCISKAQAPKTAKRGYKVPIGIADPSSEWLDKIGTGCDYCRVVPRGQWAWEDGEWMLCSGCYYKFRPSALRRFLYQRGC